MEAQAIHIASSIRNTRPTQGLPCRDGIGQGGRKSGASSNQKGVLHDHAYARFFAENLQVCHARSKKQEGSGKGGSLKKEDYAWAAVQFFFPQASHEEQLRMYNGIMNTTGTVVPCPEELLEAIDKLDPLYKEDFDDMKKVCKEQKKRQARVKAPKLSQPSESLDAQPVDVVKDLAPPVQPEGEVIDKSPLESVPASSSGGGSDKPAEAAAAAMKSPHIKSEPKLYTPVTLVELLPGRGSLPHVYLKRLPGERKQYQGFYPGLCIHQTKFVTQLDDQSSKARVTRQHSD